MKKALSGQLLWGAFALSLAALLTACQNTPTRTAVELNRLQGHWEGEGAGGKCSIIITGNSLHYRARTTWYEATFVLPANTDPQQLRATIKDCGPSKDTIGKVVFVIYKIEDGILTLSTYDPSDEPPKTFNSANLYVVEKVEPQKKNADSSSTCAAIRTAPDGRSHRASTPGMWRWARSSSVLSWHHPRSTRSWSARLRTCGKRSPRLLQMKGAVRMRERRND